MERRKLIQSLAYAADDLSAAIDWDEWGKQALKEGCPENWVALQQLHHTGNMKYLKTILGPNWRDFMQDPSQDPELRQQGERNRVLNNMLDKIEEKVYLPAASLELDGSSGDPELEKRIAGVLIECFDLWKERQRKYGRHNISAFGAAGTVVRASDKLARLRRHYFETESVASDESVEDSFRDLANYAVMGIVCHRGQWPKE